MTMHLEPEEEKILAGEYGETRQKMLEILVALGKVFGAGRLVPIRSAQVSGASYKTIGEAGLAWIRGLGARVSVPTVLNPVGMDRVSWRDMGISPGFARNVPGLPIGVPHVTIRSIPRKDGIHREELQKFKKTPPAAE